MRKKNTLYTVNRWNRPAFLPQENIFDDGGQASWDRLASKMYGADYGDAGFTLDDYMNGTTKAQGNKNWFGISKAKNPFSKGNIANTMGSIATAAAPIVGNFANSALSNGFSTGAGSAVSSLGSAAGTAIGAVNPVLGAAVSVGSGILGGLVNSAFGTKWDDKKINSIKSNTSNIRNVGNQLGQASDSSSFFNAAGNMASGQTINWRDLGSTGWLRSNDSLKDKAKELQRVQDRALAYQTHALGTSADRIDSMMDDNIMANFTALGGPIETIGNNNMGAINYGFMSDYLAAKQKQAENKNQMTNMFMGTPSTMFANGGGIHIKPSHRGRLTELKERTGKTEAELYNDGNPAHKKMVVFARNARKWKHSDGGPLNLFYQESTPLFAFGGDMQTNSSDFPSGLMHIDAGGSHSENPNDGVQLGTDQNGTPNLVEENETVWNDYVFSARIPVDEETKKKFHLPRKKEMTYADVSKKLEKEIAERVNDPISQAGFNAQMQTLAEEQERQKQEMEAERAKAAFEALSPEEQVAVMENAAQQEQMAQQAAMQEQAMAQQQAQPSSEEQAMMQQQMVQADGSQAMVGQEAPMMAEGGKLYAPGGYLWDEFWEPVNEYSKQKGNTKGKYQPDKKTLTKKQIQELEDSDAYKAFTDYILKNATDEERLKYFRWIDDNTGRDRVYTNEKGELLDGWQDKYKAARYDGLYGIQHYTPVFDPNLAAPVPVAEQPVKAVVPEVKVFHALEGDDDYIQGELDPNIVGAETRRVVLPDNAGTVIYHDRVTPVGKTSAEVAAETGTEETGIAPRHRAEWPRYAGLFGPAVGLGLMATGVGKPDYSGLEAALEGSGDVALADYQPLGDYLTYKPMDIWYEQNALNAQARATDRALSNTTNPSKAAGIIANGYNSQLASGDLYRKALEYNDALRERTATFNRGTNQFNSEAYNRNSQFNADARNRARQYSKSLALQAAAQKLDADAGWYNSLYGNLSGLFGGLSELGRENAMFNMLADSSADGVYGNLGDSYTGKRWTKKKACGGKMKNRRRLKL